jgi:hypothetical protein
LRLRHGRVYFWQQSEAKDTTMAVTVTVYPRVQTAAKKLPVSESRILGEFIRLVLINGVNPSSAASTAHAHNEQVDEQDKAIAFGGTAELVISPHNRVFYKYSGTILTLTNLVPVAASRT